VTRNNGYEQAYRNIRFERRGGCLMMQLHTDGGALKWGANPGSIHGQLGAAFQQISRDDSVRALVFTGTGESFCAEMNFAELPGSPDISDWIRLAREGYDLMMKFLDVEVPVIAAVNGPAFIHSQLPLLADIVLASTTAEFADLAHLVHGVVPGDGVHVVWPMLLGINRARHFLMTGQRLTAQRACELGVVAEVLPLEKLVDRAWELAADLERKPAVALRNTRLALTHPIKKRLLEELDHGLALESVAILSQRS
jgi:enoyl-CoA hydratase/carnithine racemase